MAQLTLHPEQKQEQKLVIEQERPAFHGPRVRPEPRGKIPAARRPARWGAVLLVVAGLGLGVGLGLGLSGGTTHQPAPFGQSSPYPSGLVPGGVNTSQQVGYGSIGNLPTQMYKTPAGP